MTTPSLTTSPNGSVLASDTIYHMREMLSSLGKGFGFISIWFFYVVILSSALDKLCHFSFLDLAFINRTKFKTALFFYQFITLYFVIRT